MKVYIFNYKIYKYNEIYHIITLKQQLPMCEIKLTQILAKNPRLIYRLNRFTSNPYTRNYTNQEIKFVN